MNVTAHEEKEKNEKRRQATDFKKAACCPSAVVQGEARRKNGLCERSARGKWDPREGQQPFRFNSNGVGDRTISWGASQLVRYMFYTKLRGASTVCAVPSDLHTFAAPSSVTIIRSLKSFIFLSSLCLNVLRSYHYCLCSSIFHHFWNSKCVRCHVVVFGEKSWHPKYDVILWATNFVYKERAKECSLLRIKNMQNTFGAFFMDKTGDSNNSGCRLTSYKYRKMKISIKKYIREKKHTKPNEKRTLSSEYIHRNTAT